MHPEQDQTPVPIPDTEHQAPDPTRAIDEAMTGLDGLDGVPVAEHVARFDAVHVALTDALSSVDKV